MKSLVGISVRLMPFCFEYNAVIVSGMRALRTVLGTTSISVKLCECDQKFQSFQTGLQHTEDKRDEFDPQLISAMC